MSKFKNMPHQQEAIDRFKDVDFFALFMEMGTGKTRTAIKIAEHKFQTGQIDSVLIIAPNHVHVQWITEQFPVHCDIPYYPFIWRSAKKNGRQFQFELKNFTLPKSEKMKVMAVNVEAFQSDSIVPYIAKYVKNNKVLIIIDEATRIKTPTAKRSKTIHKLNKYGQRAILTGTPVTKSPFGLWSMTEFLQHNYFDCNFYIFQARHGVMIQGINERSGKRYKTLIDEKTWNIVSSQLKKIKEMRGGTLMPEDYSDVAMQNAMSEKNVMFIAKQKEFKKFKRLDELKEKMDPITYYATKKECLPSLPDKVYETIFVDMPTEQKKIYKQLKSQLLAEYAGKELTVANKMSLTTRLAQVCGGFFPYEEVEEVEFDGETIFEEKKESILIGSKNAKLERIKEELDEFSNFPIIIWARFRPELELLYKELKKEYKCCLYYGSTRPAEREKIIRDFQDGEYQIFIGNPAVAGYGLNLQNASDQLFFSNSHDVEARLQAEDRSHRMGAKNACLYKDVVFKGTYDEKIVRAIKSGRDMNTFFSQPLTELLNDDIIEE